MTRPALVPGALEGVRVLDLTSVLLGPYATMLMGDMGADVVKVEDPSGDTTRTTGPARHPGMSTAFLVANRNKRSLVLDLKQPAARDALMRLVDGADVFVTSVRPQAMARLGFSAEAVLARNPRIVYAAVVGFGAGGPYAGRPAYDDIIQGGCGIAGLMAAVHGAPAYTPMVTADKTTGLMTAYSIMAALFRRERTGKGQAIEIPMLETMVQYTLMEHAYGHVFDPPEGPAAYPRLLAPWRRPYPTADGHLCMLAYNDGQWRRFCEGAGRPDLATEPRFATLGQRTANIEEVYTITGDILKTRPTAEWVEILERLEIPYMRVNKIEDLPDDPHLKAVGFFQTQEHPTEGRLRHTGMPVSFSDTPGAIRLPAPRLGEHSAEILTEAGLDEAAVQALLASGASRAA